MVIIRNFITVIDRFSDLTGRCLAWLIIALMLNSCLVVLLRYGLGYGSTFLQELVTYLHASAFMLGAAYALKHGAHVRVDIFYRAYSARGKAWIDAVGGIVLLLPLCGFIFGSSLEFVSNAWSIRESSPEPGGIPAIFLLKTLIPLMAVTLSLQGMAEVLRSALLLTEPQGENHRG